MAPYQQMNDVFISVGRTSSREENDFLRAVEVHLKSHGLSSRVVGRTDFVDENPFGKILAVMKECSGVIIIASERLVFHDGIEFPKSVGKIALPNVFLPTVWNQIEAGLAYALHLPMLMFAESSLRRDGFLEQEYDWQILRWDDLVAERLKSADFLSAFEKWKNDVGKFERENRSSG